MTIQQLRYFLALCEDLNYTHTAGRMYLSRQALRLSIAALEEELCGKLFVNNRNHLALTEKGERFRAQAAPVVQQFNALCQQAYQDIQSAPLRLGISVALVPDYLPNLGEVLEAFRQQYPGIPLELTSLSNDEVPVQLQRGALDAGLVMDLGGCAAGLARTALSQHTAAVMVCRSSPFWERTHITPAELDGQTLLVPGFAPDALAPLWQALRESSAHPQLELVEQFYQVLYRTQDAELCISEPFREIFQQPDVQCPGCNIRRSAAYLCRIPPSPKTTQRLCGAIVPLFAGEVEVLKKSDSISL